MAIIRTTSLWALSAIAVTACSSSGDSVGISADQAAGDAAKALCAKYDACSSFFIRLEYGGVDACTSAVKTSLDSALSANGTGATPAQVETCATAIGSVSCDDAIGHSLPSSCQAVAGHLAGGAACGDSSQCQSAYCHKGSNATCGACAATPAVGASCSADADCPSGAVCTKAGTCAPPGAAGASCDATRHPCKATLACKSGTCASPDGAGAPCTKTAGTTTSDTCDSLAGFYCGAQSTCVEINQALSGEPCLLVNNSLTVCSANGVCNVPSMLSTTGACLAAAAPGATCAVKSKGAAFDYAVKSPDCAPPATCENGVCTIPDAANCR